MISDMKKNCYLGCVLLCMAVAGISCGCASVRRKFARKQKYVRQEPVYVNFQEYSVAAPEQLYNDYYFFITAWCDELIEDLKTRHNHKKEQRSLREIVHNLSQIMALLNEEGKSVLEPLYEDFQKTRQAFIPNLTETERGVLLKKVQLLRLRFIKDFSYSKAHQWLEQP